MLLSTQIVCFSCCSSRLFKLGSQNIYLHSPGQFHSLQAICWVVSPTQSRSLLEPLLHCRERDREPPPQVAPQPAHCDHVVHLPYTKITTKSIVNAGILFHGVQ